MRATLVVLAVVLVGAMVASMVARNPGAVTTLTGGANDVAAWGLDRHCFAQRSWELKETSGKISTPRLVIFGTCRTVLEPWLEVAPESGGIALVDVRGQREELPMNAGCAWRSRGAESVSWTHTTERLPDLQPVADVLRANPAALLFPELRAQFPRWNDLWTRIEEDLAENSRLDPTGPNSQSSTLESTVPEDQR